MKKLLFYYLLSFACYLLFFAAPTFAHNFGPVPAGGCPAGHTDNLAGLCWHTGCTDPADNPSGTSLPGQQTDFSNLMSQIGTQSTCTDSVVGGGVIDYCVTSTQLEEQYCVVNAAFSDGRCFQTQSACPPSTPNCVNGACVASSGSTCNDSDSPGTSLPGQQTDFSNLMSQIGTRGTCIDSVVTGGTIDYCVTSTQLEEQYCVVNAAFSNGRCFQTQSSCPSGTTCDSSRGACVPSGGGTYPAPTSGGGGLTGLGVITSPLGFNLPFISGDANVFVAGLVRNGIAAMIFIAFVVALIWTILAGFKFILANGEPKEVSAAWSQIRYGLIGLAVIMSAFAIIRIAETFFGVDIISGGLRLPTRSAP